MNILEIYLKKIQDLIIKNKNSLKIDSDIDFLGTTVETPPQEFNFDLSSNIALVLAKRIKQSPLNLAESIKQLLLENLNDFSRITVAGPGFINLKFSSKMYQELIMSILKANKKYGSSNKNETYNIEFVSANPTGPMHVGHSRGAIFGDVLANLLKFNGNDVTKEYYINDYGNQIINFTESVFYRLREIKFNEKFPKKENLYPGDYVIDIAKNILKEHFEIDLSDFKKIFFKLSEQSLKHSMNLIKTDLQALGISHDNFVSERSLVEKNCLSISCLLVQLNLHIYVQVNQLIYCILLLLFCLHLIYR